MIDPSLVLPLPTPVEMNFWDQAAAKMGLTTRHLMENASRAAYYALTEKYWALAGRTVLCFAGSGNNGGDAIALAKHLHDARAMVTLLLVRPIKEYRGAPGFYLRLARRAGVVVKSVMATKLAEWANIAFMGGMAQPDIIVDGLLGTGLKGNPRPPYDALIETLNHLGQNAFVLALDIPSGLSGLTGKPSRHTVAADLTVTFEAAKLGLVMPCAKPYTGELVAPGIGIPGAVREAHPAAHHLLTPALAAMLPKLDDAMHKGTAGKLLIAGGSPGLTGAPVLAALGALRAGAGLVTVACPQGIEVALKTGHPDIMTLPLDTGQKWTSDMAREIAERITQFDALVVGPGMGRGADAADFLSSLATALGTRAAGDGPSADAAGHAGRSRLHGRTRQLRAIPGGHSIPIVWDADALFWLAANPRTLPFADKAIVTPHPGEAARLLGVTITDVEADRPRAVRELAARTNATAILKGPATLVCAPSDSKDHALWPVFVSPFAEPNLAVGGSGDVLAGVMGSLLARGVSPLLAASLGVYWHGLAGRMLSGDFPYRGNLASEIASALPAALTEWLHAHS